MAEAAQRVGRLADQAGGGSMITTKTLASFDDDGEEEVLHRLNIILKVCIAARAVPVSVLLGRNFNHSPESHLSFRVWRGTLFVDANAAAAYHA